MGSKLTKAAYTELIKEDIEWVKEHEPDSLTSGHIIMVLMSSIDHHYNLGMIGKLPHISGLDIDYIVRAFIKVSDGESFYGDHGCIECFPSSEIADGEFTCAYHQAKTYAERMQPPTESNDDE